MTGIQNRLFIVLLISSISVWSYNTWLILNTLSVHTKKKVRPGTFIPDKIPSEDLDRKFNRVSYLGKFRDPFKPDVIVPTPETRPKQRQSMIKNTAPVTIPDLVLLGILWSVDSPIATLQTADGKVLNLKEGMVISNVAIFEIQTDMVRLKKENRMFDLRLSKAALKP